MATDLTIEASMYKDGPTESEVHTDFPTTIDEAIAKFGKDNVLAGFVKSYVIAVQQKMRAQYKAPSSGVRTKRGSALAQIAAANRRIAMQEASTNAEKNVA